MADFAICGYNLDAVQFTGWRGQADNCRVVRGGSFAAGGGLARCAVRYGFDLDFHLTYDGFRCAAAPFSQPL